MTAAESHDQATIRALREIDPDLAGLFIHARRICNEPDSPGLVYLLAHAGRELTDCLMRELSGEGRSSEPVDAAGEGFRTRIGHALGCSPNHESVRRWFAVHQEFASSAHARVPAPSIDPLRPAFNELAELLYGRVGSYFETQAEIDTLAATADPRTVRPEQLRALLLRPVQRRRFFGRINSAEWLQPLEAAGLFKHPPGRITYEDKSWRGEPWPEGDYLLRMASRTPEVVSRILLAVPDTNDNPSAWYSIAKSVAELPVPHAAPLVRKLARALRRDFGPLLAHHAIEAAKALASNRDASAFDLVDALLWPAPDPPLPADGHGYIEALREARRSLFWSDRWTLHRVDDHDLDRIVDEVLPLLDRLAPQRNFDFLVNRVHRLTKLVAGAITRHSLAFERATIPDPLAITLDEADDGDIDSHRWCPELDHADPYAGVRQKLAVATFARARTLSMSSAGSARAVIELLESKHNEIFRRMVLGVIASAAELDDTMREHLDAFLASPEALDPPFAATEAAALLRGHFHHASPDAQRAFTNALERGPGQELLDRMAEYAAALELEVDRDEHVREWQARRLRWFHDRFPDLLQNLAQRLGVTPAKPGHWEQALDKGRSAGRVISGARHRSPMSADQLRQLDPHEFVRSLAESRSPEQHADPFESPAIEGLRVAVASLAAHDPMHVATLVPAIANGQDALPLHHVTDLLTGLRSAIQQQRPVPMAVVIDLATHAWRRADRTAADLEPERMSRYGAPDAACDLVIEYVQRSSPPPDASAREVLWVLLDMFARSPLAWHVEPDSDTPSTWARAASDSHTALGARVAEALYQLAWCDFVEHHGSDRWPPRASTAAGDRLTPILDAVLARDGPATWPAHGVLGRHLNQLIWMAHDWTIARLPRLLDGGTTDPGRRPAWALYIEAADLHPLIFPTLRPWYADHAAALPLNDEPPVWDPDRSHAEHFTLHVTWATLRGLVKPGDNDRLLENTFARVPVSARRHAYWSIWRAFANEKKKGAIHPDVLRNVVPFWEHRLDVLERTSPGELRDDEVGGLCQLIGVRHVAPDDLIRLGQRTSALVRRKQRVTGMAWERLGTLARHDPGGTFVIVERLVDAQLSSENAYVAFDDVAPALRAATKAGGATRDRALSLINRIAEKMQSDEFGELWREAQEPRPM